MKTQQKNKKWREFIWQCLKSSFFYSSTGTNKLHGLKCVPEGPVRAVVQIAHGIAEHIDRYREFMEVLANN